VTRRRQPVVAPRGPWFLISRAEIDAFIAERWATLSAMLEAERRTAEQEPEQLPLELGSAA